MQVLVRDLLKGNQRLAAEPADGDEKKAEKSAEKMRDDETMAAKPSRVMHVGRWAGARWVPFA